MPIRFILKRIGISVFRLPRFPSRRMFHPP